MLLANACKCLQKSIPPFLPWELSCVISHQLLTLLSHLEVQTWVSSLQGSEASFGSEQTHLFKASSEEPLLCHTCCALPGGMGITALWWASWVSPQTKLYCEPRILKTGEGFGDRTGTHPWHKQKQVIRKSHNSFEQQWNRTENATLTSLGLLRVNKLTLLHYVQIDERSGNMNNF